MMNIADNIADIAEKLRRNQVVAYPTEAVFGLGCQPLSESAVNHLLVLKQRPVEKGLILIAHALPLLLPFIDQRRLHAEHFARLQADYPVPTTFIVPANPQTPKFLTGCFDGIAVRLSRHAAVAALCRAMGFALTSTSANLSGKPPCRTAAEVRSQFGADFPVLDMPTGGAENPSEIRDLLSNRLIRQG